MLRRRTARTPLSTTATRAATVALLAAVTVTALPVGAAAADTVPVSQSRGFFLAGSAGGTDLATLVDLTPAVAVNTGGATVTSADPLAATVLGALTLPIGPVNVPIGDATGLQLGVLNQFAQAVPDGSATASSGAIADNGAISAGATTPGSAGTVSLDLANLAATSGLPAGLGTLLSSLGDVSLTAGALAGRADQAPFAADGTPGAQQGTYRIGSLTLDLQAAGALTGLLDAVTAAATALRDAAQAAVDTLTATPLAIVTVSGTLPDPAAVTAALTTLSGPGFSADLVHGSLSIDLAALLAADGLDIDALPPDTDLTAYLVQALPSVARSLTTALTAALTASAQAFVAALGSITVTVAGIPVPLDASPLSGLVTTFGALSSSLTSTVTGIGNPLGTALGTLGSALRQLLGLTANVQADAAGTFTETALSLALLPNGVPGAAAAAAALQLDLAGAAVGPGAPLAAVVPTPTPTPTTSVPMLADTGPTQTLGGLAAGVWALVAGLTLLAATGWTIQRRRIGAHRA